MFTRDPFDIAPAARRPTRATWLVLAFGIVFAAVSAMALVQSLSVLNRARDAASAQEEARRAQARRDAAARERAKDPATLEKLRAQQQVQRTLRMSWAGLFDALEHAARKMDGRVSVTSLSPVKTQADGAEVAIVGLALNNDVLLQYLEALQDEAHVREAVLTSQQAAQSAGMAVTRFQLSLVWEPAP